MASLSQDPCPNCHRGSLRGYLTKPQPCQGYHRPGTNEGRFFQRCQYNNFHPEASQNPCPGYVWRDDIPRKNLNSAPPPMPQGLIPFMHLEPQLAFNSPVSAQSSALESPSTTPQRPARAARKPCASTTCTQLGSKGGHRHAQCVWQFCKTCCQRKQTPELCPAPRHNEPIATVMNSVTVASRTPSTSAVLSRSVQSASHPPLTYEKPMARMVDASYALKISRGDHDLAVGDHFQRELYRKSHVHATAVRVWLADGKDGLLLEVSIPSYPYFHPKDCQVILDLTPTTNWTTYSYWKAQAAEWVLTNTAMQIRSSESTLYLRLPIVTDCPGGPVAQPKRRLSDTSSNTPTPAVRRRVNGKRRDISPIRYDTGSRTSTSEIIELTSEESETDDPKAVQALPLATSAAPSATTSSSSSSSAAPIAPKSTVASAKFPFRYACDMDAAFNTMQALAEGNVRDRFTEAFKTSWASTTFYRHQEVWSGLEKGIIQTAVAYGQTPEGEWKTLVRQYEKNKNTRS